MVPICKAARRLSVRGYAPPAHPARGADRHQATSPPCSKELLRRSGDDARAVRRRVAGVSEEPSGLISTDRCGRAAHRGAGGCGSNPPLPRAQRAQHLRGEGFVDLVEVESCRLSCCAPASRDGDGRRHQQPSPWNEVDRGDLRVADPAQHLMPCVAATPPKHQAPAAPSVSGVNCLRSRAAPEALSNAGFSVAASQRRVRARCCRARRAEADHQVVEKPRS